MTKRYKVTFPPIKPDEHVYFDSLDKAEAYAATLRQDIHERINAIKLKGANSWLGVKVEEVES